MNSAKAVANLEARRIIDLLQKAGPHHNIDATRKILKAITVSGKQSAAVVPSEPSP